MCRCLADSPSIRGGSIECNATMRGYMGTAVWAKEPPSLRHLSDTDTCGPRHSSHTVYHTHGPGMVSTAQNKVRKRYWHLL